MRIVPTQRNRLGNPMQQSKPFFKWQSDGASSMKAGAIVGVFGCLICGGDPCGWSSTIAWREFLWRSFSFISLGFIVRRGSLVDLSQPNHEFEIIFLGRIKDALFRAYIYLVKNNSNRTSCGPANAMSGICIQFPLHFPHIQGPKKLYWESFEGLSFNLHSSLRIGKISCIILGLHDLSCHPSHFFQSQGDRSCRARTSKDGWRTEFLGLHLSKPWVI